MDTIKQTIYLVLLVFTSIVLDAEAYERCSSFLSCKDGYFCCNYDTHCCSNDVLTVWTIIGIVVGCILFISCVIAVICCLVKQNGRPGRVIQPVQQPGVAVIATGQNGQPRYGQPMYGQPSYGQQPYGQQQYGFQPPIGGNKAGTSDPVYPPPAYNPPPESY